MDDAAPIRLLPVTPDPAAIAPFALRGLAGLLLFVDDRGEAPTSFAEALGRWKKLPSRRKGAQAPKLGLRSLDRLNEVIGTACLLGGDLPALTSPAQRRAATIALLRLLVRLDLIRSRRTALPDPGEPIPMAGDEAGRLHARAIELLLRSAITQSYADQDLLVERLRAWQSEAADKWLNVADGGDVLSGFDLKDLAALFVHVSEFPARYADIYRNSPFVKLGTMDQRKTLELFLEDACEIRNRIAHHKPLTGNQVALLALYWDEVAIPMAEAHARRVKAAVDPAPLVQQDDRLAAWVAELQRHAARTEEDSAFLRDSAIRTVTDLGIVRTGVATLTRHSRAVLAGVAILLAGIAAVLWQTGGLAPRLDGIAQSMKLETSADPRKELMNRGVPWDAENLLKAMQAGDVSTVSLFLAGGMDPGIPYQGCNVLWYAIARGMAKASEQVDMLAKRKFDLNAIVECQPSASANYTAPPLSTAILYRNGPVTDALLSHGVRVTAGMVAMLSQRPVAGTAYADQYAPRLRDRLRDQAAGLPPAEALLQHGLATTPVGLVSAIELGDVGALGLYEALRTPVDQPAAFLALAGVAGEPWFASMLQPLGRLGLDLAAKRRTQDYQNAEPQTLLTHAIRLRSDAATRALVDAGLPVTEAELAGLAQPYRNFFSDRENEPGFPGRWRPELLQRRAPRPGAQSIPTTPALGPPVPQSAPFAALPPPAAAPAISASQTRMRANLRGGPAATTPLVATVEVATPVDSMAPCTGQQTWCQVRTLDGRQGWIAAELLEARTGSGPVRGPVSVGQDTGWATIGSRTFRLIGVSGVGGAPRQSLDNLMRQKVLAAECVAAEGAYSCRVGAEDLGAMIVAAGAARASDGRFMAEQQKAQRARLGLWSN